MREVMSQVVTIEGKEYPIEYVRDNWALALMGQGTIVKLSIARWRATATLTPEMLGLSFVDGDSHQFSKQYISLGKQKLLPPDVLKQITQIENRARKCIDSYSFNTVWGKFVPFTAFDEWESENEKIREEFMACANDLVNRYDGIVNSVKDDYKNMARDVWKRLYPNSETGPTASFIENFVSKVINKMPRREDFLATFKYDTTLFIIPMPSFVEQNVAEANEIKRKEEMAQFETDLEKQTKKKIANQYVEKKKELIDGFLESTVYEMRKYVAELCDSVLESLMGSQKDLKQSQINKLNAMIKRVKLLNFHNDEEVNEKLDGLSLEINRLKGERNKGIISDKLKQLVEMGKKEFVPEGFNPTVGYLDI